MECASKKAYVSKNFIEVWQKKKEAAKTEEAKQQQEKESKLQNARRSSLGRRRSMSRSRSRSDSGERVRSIWSIYDADLNDDLNNSDNEQEEVRQLKQENFRVKKAKVFKQEVDVNVFNIRLSTLNEAGELATGDPVFCTKCNAAFNIYSKLENEPIIGSKNQIWKCEFCYNDNLVFIEHEEIPKSHQVNYILEAAAQVQEKKSMGKQEISVVFCMDISGSMCVSKPIIGKHSIKGDKTGGLKDLMKFSDGSDQRLQGEQNCTYISRMQCVQAAIDNQISEMANGAPERKLGIVTFNHEVTIIGDGSTNPQVIAGDKLYDYDFLINNGITEGSSRLQKSIKDTKSILQQKLMALEETGPTALGPALATAISMAASGAPGSSVILCTDGLANVGLGAFDEIKNEEQSKKVDEFYEMLGQFAKSKGVTVSIISIEGEECNIDTLSTIAELTGGSVERVDPIQLTQNFANILQLPVIATNVQLKVKLHKGLEFRNEDPANLSEDKSLMGKDLGNVTEETEVTFEYRLKSIRDLVKMDDIDLTQIKDFPFQAQITYNSLDGSKCIRIISNQQSISNDREELEKNANYEILSTNAIQQSSKLAKRGQMREAQAYAKSWNRKMRSNITNEDQVKNFQNYNKHFGEVYNMINEEQEHDEGMHSGGEEAKKQESKPKKEKGVFGKLGDKISAKLYNASKINKKKLNM